MLEPILQGLLQWIYKMCLEIFEYAAEELMGVMSMDLTYFKRTAPVIKEIAVIFLALGWALLLGNLVFQLIKSMMSGAGLEGEDPKTLFLRTFAFSFLLFAADEICEICSGITGTVIELLRIPRSVSVSFPAEAEFSELNSASWLLVILVGFVLMVQLVKLFFEIGERYVITAILTFTAPVAFAMGGSKNTSDIFKGWCRMYASMNLLMILNIVFLKLILSAMSKASDGWILLWLVFVVALTRVARQIDSHIGKLGMSTPQSGNAGMRFPGAMTVMAVRTAASLVSKSAANAGSSHTSHRSGQRNTSGSRPHYSPNTGGTTSNRHDANTNNAGGDSGHFQNYAGGSPVRADGSAVYSQSGANIRLGKDSAVSPVTTSQKSSLSSHSSSGSASAGALSAEGQKNGMSGRKSVGQNITPYRSSVAETKTGSNPQNSRQSVEVFSHNGMIGRNDSESHIHPPLPRQTTGKAYRNPGSRTSLSQGEMVPLSGVRQPGDGMPVKATESLFVTSKGRIPTPIVSSNAQTFQKASEDRQNNSMRDAIVDQVGTADIADSAYRQSLSRHQTRGRSESQSKERYDQHRATASEQVVQTSLAEQPTSALSRYDRRNPAAINKTAKQPYITKDTGSNFSKQSNPIISRKRGENHRTEKGDKHDAEGGTRSTDR